MGINPSANTSLILSISSTVLVVNVPIGVLSNWERFNERIFLYTFTLRSFTTFCPSHAVIYEK